MVSFWVPLVAPFDQVLRCPLLVRRRQVRLQRRYPRCSFQRETYPFDFSGLDVTCPHRHLHPSCKGGLDEVAVFRNDREVAHSRYSYKRSLYGTYVLHCSRALDRALASSYETLSEEWPSYHRVVRHLLLPIFVYGVDQSKAANERLLTLLIS